MREGQASRTAQHNALFRALESSLPERRRLFDDPLARSFLTWPLSFVARLGSVPGLREVVPWVIDRRWPGVRSSVVARTRLIDEAIAACIGGDTEQLVLLGAGFDSRPYRLPGLRDLTVFEVDHPDTLAARRRALECALPAPPEHVRFVASDFDRRDLESAMAAAGYRESAQSLFLWEGVTHYLTEAAVDATLRWCARAAPGSRLLFTYVHRDILTRPDAFVGSERLFTSLEKVDERIRFGIEPAELPRFLAARGLSLQRDVGAAEYRALYLGEAARRIRGHEFYRVALARVEPDLAHVAVGPSPIEGLGVFAARPLRAGQRIRRVNVVREVSAEAPIREEAGERIEHCAYPDGKVTLWGFPDRHVNHCCDPSAYELYDGPDVTLVARRDIDRGEEITVDYNVNTSGGNSWPCRCGAARCRGESVGEFFALPKEQQREYRPLLAAWFVRRHRERIEALDADET